MVHLKFITGNHIHPEYLFYAYAVSGVDGIYLKEGLNVSAETMARFGGGTMKGLEVFVK